MFCKKCGKELSESENFCPQCGTPTIEQPASVTSNSTTPKKKTKTTSPAVVIIVILVVLFLLGIIISISSMNSVLNETEGSSITPVINNTNPTITAEDVVTGKDWEFKIKDIVFSQRINPPSTPSFYTYYQVKDTNNTYLCITLDVKNLSELDLSASNFATVKVKYDNKYTYSSFSAIPDKVLGFTYTNITNIKPLTSDTLYFLSEMPKNIADETNTPIQIEIKCEDKTYIYNYR